MTRTSEGVGRKYGRSKITGFDSVVTEDTEDCAEKMLPIVLMGNLVDWGRDHCLVLAVTGSTLVNLASP